LTQAAQLKADDMATNSYYAHISPDGKSPLYWLQAVGYKYLNAGENLVIDRNTSEEAVDAWMNSPDHRENILRPQFTEVGIGVASGVYQGIPTTYVVEEFGTPYPLSAPAVRKIVPPPVVQATTPTKPVLVTDVQALVTPILKSIAPTVSTKPASVPVTTASPAPVVHPVSKPAVAMASHSTSTVTHSTQPVAQATSSMPAPLAVTTSSSTPFNYTLAPEFFTPVSFADTRSQTILASEETVPATHNPTPTWYISFSLFLSRIANFVPRIW
jgi:hypothetical protein